MRLLAIIAALVLALAGALWWGMGQREQARAARAERDLYARQIAQARVAEAIARDLLTREQSRAEDLAEALARIYGGPDAPLPDHIRKLLGPDGL